MSKDSTQDSSEIESSISRNIKIIEDGNDSDEVLEAIEFLQGKARGNDLMKEKIGLSGGAEILVKCLDSGDLELQKKASFLLRSLSVNERNRDKLVEVGAVPILIKILKTYDDFALKLACTATIWNISVNEKNKEIISKEGAIPILVDFIKSNDVKLQNEALGALRNLSTNDENKKIIGKEGAIGPLVNLLYSSIDKIQRSSALTLKNLCTNNEKNLKRVEREKGVEMLNHILAKNGIEYENSQLLSKDFLKMHFDETIKWEDLVLLQKIGEGKYGNVYKAKYHDFPVACKIIKKKLTDKDAESILEELKIMRRLKHPNIVLLMGACLNPVNQVVIVTEYLPRGNLKECMADVKKLSRRLNIAYDIASGLSWLHAQDVVHRDLKLANLLVADDWTVKISDFGLSLDLRKREICRGFKGNVKYSPPEILKARYDKSITVYPYSEKTDVYAFALMFWELLSLKPLFPNIEGKEELTKHVLDGHRPLLLPTWPDSVKDLLNLSWHENPSKRPNFSYILKNFDQIYIDLMCPDMTGRKICKKLWKGRRDAKINYSEFEKTFIEGLKLDFSKIKKIHVKCFCSILCNPYDDTVTFERFCEVVSWFGPLHPVEMFFKSIKDLLSEPCFYGFLSLQKASHLVKNCYATTKQPCYLYRFSSTDMGALVLTFIDKKGDISHKKIYHIISKGYRLEETNMDFPTFDKLHKACRARYKLKKTVPGSPYQVHFM